MITAAGVGSGIDVESILTQLMELERQPADALTARRQSLDVQLSAFGSIKSAMNELATSARTLGDSGAFGPFIASSTDDEVFTANATGSASNEFHDIEVISLAQNHRLASQAYDSATAEVATGSWSFTSGDNNFSVDIDAGSNSLLDLKSAINDSVDNTSVFASILNVDGGSRLILTAKNAGSSNSISFGGNAAGANLTQMTAATDASLIVDGFAVTSASNLIDDIIPGISLNLKSVGEAQLESSRDTEGLRASLDTFVERYNSLRTTLDNLSSSQLQGDNLPRGIENGLRNVFSTTLNLENGSSVSPLSLGFTFDRYGTLSIDDDKLADAQGAGLENFIEFFAQADNGLSDRFDELFDSYTRSDGIIKGREDGLDNRKSTIDRQIERMDYRLERTEERLRRQFTVMDQLVTQLQSTSNFLVSRLG